ncbi:mandelate racemase / muconate lactonizing enzyme, C-terminal domain protein [Mycobacterium xenopi 3993]|nr:mandelate racemase / muconate lactonizing enzyme, C-terminal domain protein [Mycobacterium xenopi 3993]
MEAVRALIPTVRVDANGGWTVGQAVEAVKALTATGPLEYLEQPCRTVEELAELRRQVDVPSPPTKASAKPTTRSKWSAPTPPMWRCSKLLRWAAFRRFWRSPSKSTSRWWFPARWIRRSGSPPASALPPHCRCWITPAGWAPAAVRRRRRRCRRPGRRLPAGHPRHTGPSAAAGVGGPPSRRQWWIDRVKACYPLLALS